MPNDARVAGRRRGRSGSGRSRVRRISASVSRSYTWLRTAAPPATSAVPPTASAIGSQLRSGRRAEVVAGRARRHDEEVQPRLGQRDVVADAPGAPARRPAAARTAASACAFFTRRASVMPASRRVSSASSRRATRRSATACGCASGSRPREPHAPAAQRDHERRGQHERAADDVHAVDPDVAAAQHGQRAERDLHGDQSRR